MIFSCGRDTVRTFVTLLLTGLLLACPFVCGATEAGHATPQEHAAGTPANRHAPSHCPEDSDDCVCRGAVQSNDVRVPNADAVGLPFQLLGLAGGLAHSPAHSLAHLTIDGSPAGLAGWGNATAVRALLQNYRC